MKPLCNRFLTARPRAAACREPGIRAVRTTQTASRNRQRQIRLWFGIPGLYPPGKIYTSLRSAR